MVLKRIEGLSFSSNFTPQKRFKNQVEFQMILIYVFTYKLLHGPH